MRIDIFFQLFFNWQIWIESFPHLYSGLKITLMIAVTTLLFATVLALLIALVRNLQIRWLNWFIVAYIDAFRSLPPLAVLIILYYALPFVGPRLQPFPATVVALTLLNSAYIAEVFRSGIEAIERGQIEAARALGMTASQTIMLVILPQAFRIVIPPLASNLIFILKDTALASVVAVPELMREARQTQSIHLNPSPIMAATFMYLAILIPLVRLTGLLEAWGRSSRLGSEAPAYGSAHT